MNKQLAAQHDQFLAFLSTAFLIQEQIEQEEMWKYGETRGIRPEETNIILDILVSDNVLNQKAFKSKSGTTYSYSYNPKMSKLIYEDGGYKRRRILKKYEEGNIKFAYLRHWIWFVLFVISLLFNMFLIANYAYWFTGNN